MPEVPALLFFVVALFLVLLSVIEQLERYLLDEDDF